MNQLRRDILWNIGELGNIPVSPDHQTEAKIMETENLIIIENEKERQWGTMTPQGYKLFRKEFEGRSEI